MDNAILDLMLQDMADAPREFQPTQFWKTCLIPIVKDLKLFGFHNFRILPSSLNTWVPLDDPIKALKQHEIFRKHDLPQPPFLEYFSQSTVGTPCKPLTIEEKQFTITSLNYLRALSFLKQRVDTSSIRTVFEIGAGYGVLGEILYQADAENYFYIDVDIPPLAAVATYYLQTALGEEAILDYRQSREMETLSIEELSKQYRGMVICPWQLPKLVGKCELAVNLISFQEMEPDIVQNYAGYINRLTTNYLLLRNSNHGKLIAKNPQDCGVLAQTTREHYLRFFSEHFTFVDGDSDSFGENSYRIESEVMIFQKKL